MQEYCVDEDVCRRKMFYDKFTERKAGFKRCGNMCDNCKSFHGHPRRKFVGKEAAEFEPSGRRYGGGGVSSKASMKSSDEESSLSRTYPSLNFETIDRTQSKTFPRFQPASQFMKASSLSTGKALSVPTGNKSLFLTASGKTVSIAEQNRKKETVADFIDVSEEI